MIALGMANMLAGCGGAGMPCPSCNVSNPDNPQRLPAGFQVDESVDDHEQGE
jgi:hypothetical protein